jgi:hypothetical protein
MPSSVAVGGISIPLCFLVDFLAKRYLLKQEGYAIQLGGIFFLLFMRDSGLKIGRRVNGGLVYSDPLRAY